jgi:hypothetical protein
VNEREEKEKGAGGKDKELEARARADELMRYRALNMIICPLCIYCPLHLQNQNCMQLQLQQ